MSCLGIINVQFKITNIFHRTLHYQCLLVALNVKAYVVEYKDQALQIVLLIFYAYFLRFMLTFPI